jgi:glycosyltransferase involved in cell wall biosynthesis
LPTVFNPGKGTAILVHGSFARPPAPLRRLNVTVNGRRLKTDWRHDTFDQLAVIEFWSVVRLATDVTEYRIGLETRLAGQPAATTELGPIRLESPNRQPPRDHPWHPNGPRVAICMTTYNPRSEFLQRQIDSIKRQTYRNWTCFISDDNSEQKTLTLLRALIGDDARFRLHAMPDRVGFYRNFERCLGLVSDDADLVTLSDHDDYWHPDKLEKLVTRIGPSDTLVYSDMNIVDGDLRLSSKTYWTTRRNNYERLDLLLAANTVTGAASMFRRSLLEYVLPFPQPTGESFHDHWIAVVALALGTLSYVDEPLYDYVQHQENVIGHAGAQAAGLDTLRPTGRGWRYLLKRAANPNLDFWRDVYLNDVLRLRIMAETILLRLDARLDKRRRATLHRFAVLDRSVASLAWLAVRSAANLIGPNYTLFAENRFLRGVMWKRVARGARPST